MKKINALIQYGLLVLMSVLIWFPGRIAIAAQQVRQIAVIPFQINAAEDMSFLQNGITDMLETRLAWENRIKLIPRSQIKTAVSAVEGRLDTSRARQLAKELKADYVLFGSVTVLGNNVSLDAKLVDADTAEPMHTFAHQSQGFDDVIPQVNRFASEINAKVFGRTVETTPAAGAVSTDKTETYGGIHAHPEKLIEGGFGDIDQEGSSGALISMAGRNAAAQFWKSRDIREPINGLDLGDIDGDKKTETVVVTDQQIHVYEFEADRFYISKSIARDKSAYYIGIDVADINGNGIDEIFVTALTQQRNSVNSFVLEFSGQEVKKLVTSSNYFYRVIDLPGRGKVLLGQENKGEPFKGYVTELVWDGSDYKPGDRIGRFRNNNLIGATYGNVMNEGTNWLVAYNTADRIQILKSTGKSRWTSGELYGGNMMYFAGPKTESGQLVNPLYLPMRLRITDVNQDGKYEVTAARNHDIVQNLLKDFRRFNKSHIEILEWDGIGLSGLWKTRSISGRTSDFAIGDFDNDGIDELVAAIISKEGDIVMTTARSTIIAYELKFTEENQKK